jgi:formate dehydrogenase gamma subunit
LIYRKIFTALGMAACLALATHAFQVGGTHTPAGGTEAARQQREKASPKARVCPPFFLRDSAGNVINPITGENADQPYSPRETCGACHDYKTITEGYHFQQGADEAASKELGERYQWVSTPGNYGGAWCSPAPLYSYLSPKKNDSAKQMDMTSFSFITRGCGACHPGGGPAEFDREGKRYDAWMADPASGLTPGGENNFDGDYHKARWSESGVLEADCLLCHLPSYDFKKRGAHIAGLNFRWAPTAAAGLAAVEGAVADNKPVTVSYDKSKFDTAGRVSLPMVVSPPNETCLQCHAQPGWKKRGADYRGRTDVHLRAQMRCVDCHPAGSRAEDPRIRGREVHQIAKGDDPGGKVRDDLDNTVRNCDSCHSTGAFGAPIALHADLPPLHLRRIACQTCHTPEKLVMPIQVQASDVFNDDTHIQPGGKQLWTFYGVDGAYRNHYGILTMMGYDNKPTEKFRPVLARYKNKIYPVNRVHSTWPGIETPGRPGLMQPRTSDIRKMWLAHRQDPQNYPELALMTDDNGDGILEVNRPEEIDALIAAVTACLKAEGYPLEGKRVVWVANNRVYASGKEFRELPMAEWEASPYGNVHKYNHDIQPARAALGATGCADCHAADAPFFKAAVLVHPFDNESARGVWVPNHEILGISATAVALGAFRENVLKPATPWILGTVVALLLLHLTIQGPHRTRRVLSAAADAAADADTDTAGDSEIVRFTLAQRLAHFFVLVGFLVLAVTGLFFLHNHRTFNGEPLRTLHTWIGLVFAAGWIAMFLLWFRDMLFAKGDKTWLRALGGYWGHRSGYYAGKFNAGQKIFFWILAVCGVILIATGAGLAALRDDPRANLALLYTLHDLAAVLALVLLLAHVYLAVVINPHSLRSIFGGRVSRRWIEEHHPHALEDAPALSESIQSPKSTVLSDY